MASYVAPLIELNTDILSENTNSKMLLCRFETIIKTILEKSFLEHEYFEEVIQVLI